MSDGDDSGALDETLQAGPSELQETLSPVQEAFLARTAHLIDPSGGGGRAALDRVAPTLGSTADPERLALHALNEEAAAGRPRVDLGVTIGSGGMGIVRVGTQRSLLREVAVKTLRDDVDIPPHAFRAALQEAWINGALQHPNIVPIHDLSIDESGRPIIVMKRIEGRAWRELIADPVLAGESATDDPLGWHLRTLIQVCRAVEYAHSRHLVHRDIKPDNVMVGAFGEVYLLDWGIAVALKDDGSGRFPIAPDHGELAGTPVYMAPEMLGEGDERVDERADVYLLGATLYHVLEGEPPHLAGSQVAVMRRVLLSAPDFTSGAPAELVDICRRAMAPKRADRFASAADFRRAVERFLAHRASVALAAEAHENLGQLEGVFAAGDRQQIYARLGACRLGFRQALRDWPDNAAAQEGLVQALEAVAEWELDAGDERAAEALITELTDPSEVLVERVAAVRAQRLAAEAETAALRQAADANLGGRNRLMLFVPIAVLVTFLPMIDYFRLSETGFVVTHGQHIARTSLVFGALVLGAVWFHRSSPRTFVNRLLVSCTVSTGAVTLAVAVGCAFSEIAPMLTVPLAFPIAAVGMAVVAGATPLNTWPAVGVLLVAFGVAMRWPPVFYLVVGPAIGMLVVNIALEVRRIERASPNTGN